jgi:methyltransferase family protein
MAETAKARSRREREDWFDRYCPADRPGLDIGCGFDPVHPTFRQWDAALGHGDATHLAGVPPAVFWSVYSSHLLEHLHDPVTALRNWYRVLRPDGFLTVVVPHMDLYEGKPDLPSRWNPDHKTYWRPDAPLPGDGPHVRGLRTILAAALPDGELVYVRVLDDGHVPPTPTTHAGGEYGIEAVVRKPAPPDRALPVDAGAGSCVGASGTGADDRRPGPDRRPAGSDPATPAGVRDPALGWTVGICTDGRAAEFHDAIVESVRRQNFPAYEIVFCTEDAGFDRTDADTRTIRVGTDRPRWITRKKNEIARRAAHPNLLLLHDYAVLAGGWRQAFESLGDGWDVCCMPVLKPDGSRYWDWCTKDHPAWGHALIPYEVRDAKPWQYVSGSVFAVRREFLISHPLDESRVHGEDEDGEWSLRCRSGWRLEFCPGATVRLLRFPELFRRRSSA